MEAPKKVLVLGARGFLGEHVVAQLAAHGYEVFAGMRPGSRHSFEPSSIQILEGDLSDDTYVRDALDRVDAVIFCAGRTWTAGLPLADYWRDNVAITETFFAALQSRPSMRVVFTSSLSCMGGSKLRTVYTENTGRQGISENLLSPYDRAKIACEEFALASAQRGQPVVILNPGLILGPGANSQSNLAAPYYLLWHCCGKFASRFYANGGVTLCDVRDVALAHVTALTRGQPGERYILGGHNLDRREFYTCVSRLTGLKPPRRLPAWLIFGPPAAADAVDWLTRGMIPNPVHRSFARTQRLYYFGASDKAVAELGYTPRPLEATVLDMLQDYARRGELPRELGFLEFLTDENSARLLLLRQLAQHHAQETFLLARLPQLDEISQSNHELRKSIFRLLTTARFDDAAARYRWDRGTRSQEVRTIHRFFDYLYFSSDEFLRQVM